VWSHVPVSPADLPGSLGLGESLRVSPSLSESHLGLEHPGRDLLARARLGLSLRPKFCFKNNKRIITGPVTKTLFFPSYRRRSIPAGTRRGDAGGTGGVQRHDSGGVAGESAPAGLTKMAATMKRFVAVVSWPAAG
jgi:hypothetical protein